MIIASILTPFHRLADSILHRVGSIKQELSQKSLIIFLADLFYAMAHVYKCLGLGTSRSCNKFAAVNKIASGATGNQYTAYVSHT